MPLLRGMRSGFQAQSPAFILSCSSIAWSQGPALMQFSAAPHSPLFNSFLRRLLQRRAGPPAAGLPAAVPEPGVGARLGRRHALSGWRHRHRRACKPAAFLACLAAALAPLGSGLHAGSSVLRSRSIMQYAEGGLFNLPAATAMQCRTVASFPLLRCP